MGELQEKVLLAERVLLFAMGFNLGVGSQPIVLMASFLAEFKHAAFTSAVQASLQGPPEKHLTLLPEVIVQKILSFHNDW